MQTDLHQLDEEKRWVDIDKLLLREDTFKHNTPFYGQRAKEHMFKNGKVLVIGAGGLGCEILKNLALSGVKEIHVVDLDRIDVTNLNRQFLFREKDIGKYKADVAAEFIMNRVSGCKVLPYNKKIQELEYKFYDQFQVIIAGLDNVEARSWLNNLCCQVLTVWDEPKEKVLRCPLLIDGGTEAFSGQARVIIPFKTACYECTRETLTVQKTVNSCTPAVNPRLPEHCIAYILNQIEKPGSNELYQKWNEQFPNESMDTDNMKQMQWIFKQAEERGKEFNISGVTFQLTMGVIKNIIPSIASTNALIAAACCNEVFKYFFRCSGNLNSNFMFLGQTNINTTTHAYEKKNNCIVCKRP